MGKENLYNQDICLWAAQTADLLRLRRWDELDLDHIIEEIEDLSKRERDKLLSCLKVLLTHLLKWRYQPSRRCASWEVTIKRSRNDIQELLEDTPSLKQFLSDEWIGKSYSRACKDAAAETRLPISTFPDLVPFDVLQILEEDSWPWV